MSAQLPVAACVPISPVSPNAPAAACKHQILLQFLCTLDSEKVTQRYSSFQNNWVRWGSWKKENHMMDSSPSWHCWDPLPYTVVTGIQMVATLVARFVTHGSAAWLAWKFIQDLMCPPNLVTYLLEKKRKKRHLLL